MPATRHRTILAINAGSSSIKFAACQAGDTLRPLAAGQVDAGAGACDALFAWLAGQVPASGLAAISHRLVYGQPGCNAPAEVDAALLAALRQAASGAIDHLPQQIALIEALGQRYPEAVHLACFDSAFHATLPPEAATLPIPHHLADLGVRRYGYHGISCDYLVHALAELAGPTAAQGKLVIAHLGSGASVTAVLDGQSRDTSMGCTPAGGIMMARRAGDLDPGLAWELARRAAMPDDTFHKMVNHQSGLLGVSGSSADLRELLAREATDARAALAIDMFCYQARKAICAMTGALDGIETLVFSGGIGEHAAPVRARICAGLAHLGVQLEPARNASHAAVISPPGAKVTVRVMPTDEQMMLAMYANAYLNQSRRPLP